MLAKNILIATDFSDLGQLAIEQGRALADELDAKLSVVCVFAQLTAPESALLSRSQRDRALHELRSQLAALEAELRASGRLGKVQLHLGDPAPTILLAARTLEADLIVLGTHGRRRLTMGSTAQQVMREAPVPVLIVRRPTDA